MRLEVVVVLAAGASCFVRPAARRRVTVRRPLAQEELQEHDVVEFARNGTSRALEVGVALGDGRVQPLCCWEEGDPVELVWDEAEAPLDAVDVRGCVDAWPSQRLVDGGLGPRNPHGEESEDVYAVARAALRVDHVHRVLHV